MTIPSRKHRRRVEVERLEADSTAIDVPSMAAEVAKAPEAADAVRQAGVKVGALLADDELDNPGAGGGRFVAERENATARPSRTWDRGEGAAPVDRPAHAPASRLYLIRVRLPRAQPLRPLGDALNTLS